MLISTNFQKWLYTNIHTANRMTEEVSPRFSRFDEWSTTDMVEAMHDGQLTAIAAVKPALDNIALAVDAAAAKLRTGGRLIYVGAGTSGRLAVQDGAELGPTFGWPEDRVKFCLAGGMDALITAAEGAEDSIDLGEGQIQSLNTDSHDVVICVAASGRTPFTLAALQMAKASGAMTIGIANNPDTPILDQAEFPILAKTGSEMLAGSTRMNAGTAQKAILNILSTAIMTRLGRVYQGFMVDMIVSNKKLHNRAVNMISSITKCPRKTAEQALNSADSNIKVGIMIAAGAAPQQGRALLEEAGGDLRRALQSL